MAGSSYSQSTSYTNPNNQSSYSTQGSFGQSSGTATAVQSPEAYYNMMLAQMAAGVASNQYNWAQNQAATTTGLTNQDIAAYQKEAQNAFGQQNLLQRQYKNEFMPENYALVNQAGTYASPNKLAINEGAAESGASQAGAQSLNNTKAQLQSYGVNPSAGEWAGLTRATNAQTGAAAAGQAAQASRATTATGLGLLQSAVATGAQLPGAAVNAGNLATENIGGATNAALGTETANTAAMSSAAPYMNAAMQMKLPPAGTNTTSTSGSSGHSTEQNTGGGGASQSTSASASGGGGGGGGTPSPTSGWYGSSGGGGGGGNYALGGEVQHQWGYDDGGVIPEDATQGGHVPLEASPTMGQQVDDVPARLNAEEFVVPRDVARWKGEEYFQKLIDQSRKARMAATAQPSPGPPVGHMPPRFVSQSAYGGGRIGAI